MKIFGNKKFFSSLTLPLTKFQIKLIFLFLAALIVISVIIFTQSMVSDLIEREKNIVEFYGKIFENYAEIENKDPDDFLFFIEEITPTITFPLIITDESQVPLEPYEHWSLNISHDPRMTPDQRREFMLNYVEEMALIYSPINVYDNDGNIIQKLYYTNSDLVGKLRMFPYIAIAVIFIFAVIAYLSLTLSKDNEQNKVWVGMAKEAAHQLGTPLSSLLAWLEILRYQHNDPEGLNETIMEMGKDINRLNTIAKRFSKIGSQPDREILNINDLLEYVCNYFDKRLPHLGKRIEILRSFDTPIYVSINQDLFAWVIENLLKNAAESIEENKGEVHIFTRVNPGKRIYIFVKDSGKGMPPKIRSQVFQPGFSTKKRGWGLGLSLAKRIVEDYHDGKIYIKETILKKGSTFVIELPEAKIPEGAKISEVKPMTLEN